MATQGYSDNKAAHLTRLRRIEGQVRGVARMVEEDAYCIDVLTQIAAITKALQSTALSLLDEHMDHCVTAAVAAGGKERETKLREVSQALSRLTRV
jgi:DNA-binding FrmR family transcriptional regulator